MASSRGSYCALRAAGLQDRPNGNVNTDTRRRNMRFSFDKTPKQRAREQLATQRERERLKQKEDAATTYDPQSLPLMRRVDATGVAAGQAEVDVSTRKVYAAELARLAFELAQDQGLRVRSARAVEVPDPLPQRGRFDFTVSGKNGTLRFLCEHYGDGRVRFSTDGTGDAEWEVDLRPDWAKASSVGDEDISARSGADRAENHVEVVGPPWSQGPGLRAAAEQLAAAAQSSGHDAVRVIYPSVASDPMQVVLETALGRQLYATVRLDGDNVRFTLSPP
jgi:hypothetical protein